jgi:GH24 family phage-related lysozyme (muramidase)
MARTNPDMENIGYQEGGMVPVDAQGNVPPQAVAGDVVNGAPMGMVDVPNGGGPVDDGVPTELPEGAVVINAAAIRFHGTETIDNLINTAVDELLSEGVQISMEDPNPEDNVPVAISNGEYIIPPEVAEKIGYKKLEDMNERGRAYLQKQEAQEKQKAEAQQQPPAQPSQPPPESFMGESMPPEQVGPPPAPVQSEEQAMAMMGMMDGGRVPYAEGTAKRSGFAGFLYELYDQVADKFGGSVEYAEPEFPKRLAGEKRERNPEFVPDPVKNLTGQPLVFPDDFDRVAEANGGRVPYASGIAAVARPKGLVETLNNFMKQFGNEVEPEATEVRPAQSAQSDPTTSSETKVSQLNEKDRNYSQIFAPDTFADPDSLPPAQKFGPNIQRRAEGGFVGDYNYAQPQQATMGTPFPNAVDSNPQQSQSFLRPNDAKKKSRIELKKGDEIPRPKPTPPSQEEMDRRSQQADAEAKKTLGRDKIFAYEIAGGSLEDLKKILSGELSTDLSKKAFDGTNLIPYKDSEDINTIGGINIDILPKGHWLKTVKSLSLPEYLILHTAQLKEANDWVSKQAKTNPNFELAREPLVDMHFNMGAGFAGKFKAMIAAIEAGDWATAGNEVLLNRAKDGLSLYATQTRADSGKVGGRADDNSNLLKSLSAPQQSEASFMEDSEGGFKSRHDTDPKVSNRFKLFPPQKLQDHPTEEYQNLENELFDYAEELRKRSDGLQLSDAYPVDSPETEFVEKSFNEHIDRMAEQVIKGQGYMNFERLLKDESGDTRSREELEQYRESLKDDLHRMYQKPVYDIINSGLTEKEVSDGNELTYEESLQSVPGRQNIDNYYRLESDARRRLAKKPVDPFVNNPNEDKRQQPRATPNLNVFKKTPTFLNT